ncbi:uncharacterized protein N7483_010233 [Penicillium malachiteum]|uniref:uncharacterized protein n=1 Tax=Penicillium malachiteum TaxID=1324776 RepID=UPI0025479FAF|nr:uncharacterized protein N7483_010233 [Penicillium malachiteum]KAJ5713052.1 hypothetical protein N7483_010233 [Penicillium malachiteum]
MSRTTTMPDLVAAMAHSEPSSPLPSSLPNRSFVDLSSVDYITLQFWKYPVYQKTRGLGVIGALFVLGII